VIDLLVWVVGVWSLAVDGSGLPPQVMDFTLVLMQFLLICSSSGVFPLSMAEKYWPSYCSPAGVQYDGGLAESGEVAAPVPLIHALHSQSFAFDVDGCYGGW
jgi:hypothetical protein